MQAELFVEGPSELRSLHSWLAKDRALRRSCALELKSSPPEAGEMGSVVDVLQLITDNAWNAASFGMALAAWKRSRPQSADVTVRRGDVSVTLTGGDEAQVERVVQLLSDPPPAEGSRGR